MKVIWFSRWSTLLAAMVASAALAQAARVPGFDLERLEIDPFAIGSLVLGTGEMPAAQSFRLSAAGQYELKPLVATERDRTIGSVVRDRVTLHLTAAYAVHERIALGVHIPVVAYQSSDDLSAIGIQSPSQAGFGNPVFLARLGLLRDGREAPFDLALQLGVGIPIGSRDAIASEGSFSFIPKLMAGKKVRSLFLASAEVSALIRSSVSFRQQDLGSQLGIGASLTTLGERLRGELTYRSALSFSSLPYAAELLAGARVQVSRSVELFGLAGPGFSTAPGSPTFRVLFGAALGGSAQCPREPAAEPIPLVDPCAPGNRHTPEQCPDLDDDGDGIKNKDDRCPLEAGPVSNHGCPAGEPEKAKNEEPAPPKETVTLAMPKLIISEKIYFETGKSRLLPQSHHTLDQVAAFVTQHPELKWILIEGHTDNTGPLALNMRLSQMRAESVRSYLISKNVRASRLGAKGYGSSVPIASNDTAEGRDKNRRVEFTVKDAAGKHRMDQNVPKPAAERTRPPPPKAKKNRKVKP